MTGTLTHALTKRWMGSNAAFGQVSFQNEQIVLSGHTGTHMDAQLHAMPDGADVAAVDLNDCVGPATKLDLRRYCGPRASLTGANLDEALGINLEVKPILLIDTGWSEHAQSDSREYYRNSMGLDQSAVDWIRARGVTCVGIDAPSVDSPSALNAPAHMDFFRGDRVIVVIENLRNLGTIPRDVPLFIAAPLPLEGASGSPLRALAVLEDGPAPDA
jgi:kynurenine formamidase